MRNQHLARFAIRVISALLLLTSCRSAPVEPITAAGLLEITSPGGPSSGQPNLAVGPNGDAYLTWLETTDEGLSVLRFAKKNEDGWTQVQTIVQDNQLLTNWADFPSLLVLPGGELAAHWMTTVPDREGYNVNVSLSRDSGKTWTPPVIPHRDSTPTEHGFVSLVPHPGGGVGIVWLDSRKLAGSERSDDVAMMYTNIGLDGRLGSEVPIDGRVCECCQPNASAIPGGVLAVYRDRTEKEIRDIAIVRFDGSKWSEPKTVFADNWEIYACPINGPAITAEGANVAVAWFTAPNDQPRVEIAFSKDGGATFGQAIPIDDGKPMGRVDVSMLDSGDAVVTWVERSEKSAQIRARQVGPDGTRHPSFVIGDITAGTSSGFPRMERSGNTLLFAWTDTSEDKVRTAVLNINGRK